MLENLALVVNGGALNGKKFEDILRRMQRGGLLQSAVDSLILWVELGN